MRISSVSRQRESDSDKIDDPWDNCTLVDNPTPSDTDHDGYGNRCDGDLDQDGYVGGPDFACFAGQFSTGLGPSGLFCATPPGTPQGECP